MIDLKALRDNVNGFKGRFEFRPEDEHCPDRLVFVCGPGDYEGDEIVISDCAEQHIAEPIVEMLRSVGPLLDEVESLRSMLSSISEDFDIAIAAHDPTDPRHPSHGGQHTNGRCCSFGNVTPGAVSHMRRLRDMIDAATAKQAEVKP